MQTVIISGASGGLGGAVTRRFVEERNWRVIALSKSVESAKRLASELSAASKIVSAVACDLTNTASVQRFIETSKLERLDAVVHLAGGIIAGKPIEETDAETPQAMMNLNYYTAFNLLRASLPLLKARGGAFIAIAANAALAPEKNKAGYAASKAALLSLIQSTAHEGKSYGVRAHALVPGIIDTPANREWGTPEEISRWIKPEAIAEAIWFLCNDAAKGVAHSVLKF